MFNFQHSQITQKEFEQLTDLLLKYPQFYATSIFDVGKVNSSLYLPLKHDAVFKKQRASKVPKYLQDKVNRSLEILDQNEIISPVNMRNSQKLHFHKPRYYFSKRRILKNCSRCKISQFTK